MSRMSKFISDLKNLPKKFKPQTLLLASLSASIITMLLVEFVFDDMPELFDGGHRLGNIMVNVSLSYIAAYLFYLVTVAYPKVVEKKHSEEYLADQISLVSFFVGQIVVDSTNGSITQAMLNDQSEISEEAIREAMNNVFMDTVLSQTRTDLNGNRYNVGDAVSRDIHEFGDASSELLHHSPYLESELIESILSIRKITMHKAWVNENAMRGVTIRLAPGFQLNASRRDVSCYSESIIQYIYKYRQIKSVLKDNYAHTKFMQNRFSRLS